MNTDAEKIPILLVDDRPERLLTYQAILTDLGQELLCANSGRQALEILLVHEVSVILLDVRMPDMDGFETAAMIRQHPRHGQVPIIFVSGIADVALEQSRGYQLGAIDFVTVPIVPDILRTKVAILVELHRQRQTLRRLNEVLAEANASQQAVHARELERVNQELREADRHKDEFLAILGHELRNPLAAILNAVTLMRSAAIEDRHVQAGRDIIDRQSSQLMRLVDDLLDISRIKHGGLKLVRARHDARTIVDHAVEMTRPLILERRHALSVECPDEPLFVDADFSRIVQVVGNLLSNAAKYTQDGGKVHLSVMGEPNWVTFRVEDNGIGISAEALPRVFELFSQVHDVTRYSPSGLGVGLSLVRQIVELHGGEVRAVSAGLSQGSEFSVCLPRATASQEVTIERTKSHVATPSYRILLADDNQDALQSLTMLMELEGHEVRGATSGVQALTEILSWKPQVAILDLGMPGLNGYEVARATRAEASENQPVLIALSGWGSTQDMATASEAGFNAHLTKPISVDRISAVIHQELVRHNTGPLS